MDTAFEGYSTTETNKTLDKIKKVKSSPESPPATDVEKIGGEVSRARAKKGLPPITATEGGVTGYGSYIEKSDLAKE